MAAIREKIKMNSTESAYFYTTTKNKRNTPHKLRLRKYDAILRKHVWFEEGKIK